MFFLKIFFVMMQTVLKAKKVEGFGLNDLQLLPALSFHDCELDRWYMLENFREWRENCEPEQSEVSSWRRQT